MSAKKKKEPVNIKRELWEWIKIILLAAAVAFFLNTCIIANSTVPSGSMEATIMTGDRIIGSRLSYLLDAPKRGDIVIFDHPTGPSGATTRLVKRIIGLPGEVIDIRDGQVYIDGADTPLEELYLPEAMETPDLQVQVAEGGYFMMGDNRNHSVDARHWSVFSVPEDKIIAKVLVRYFPSLGKIQ